ncbi:hypothetical protein SteCoe_28329 [Stentor coeruleus]|uniref:Uncharacterized protein n=1 Tax=Stentor coeruleus TaxID=5963 RepID=A0A1R2B8K3_9CILI|nr:hypothetical protein SteCoe_28329 [Stentor coeruleus]
MSTDFIPNSDRPVSVSESSDKPSNKADRSKSPSSDKVSSSSKPSKHSKKSSRSSSDHNLPVKETPNIQLLTLIAPKPPPVPKLIIQKPSQTKFSIESVSQHKDQIHKLYSESKKLHNKLKLTTLQKLFSDTIHELNLFANPHHLTLFTEISEDLAMTSNVDKHNNKKPTTIELTFEEYLDLVKLWGEKYNKFQETMLGKLSVTIKEYQDLYDLYQEFPDISKILQDLVSKLNKSNDSQGMTLRNDTDFQTTIKKNIEEIFSFYARAQKIQGAADTFEGLESSNTTWNLGKFLKFASDFKILTNKFETERGLSKDQLISVFKKKALNSRLMRESEFIDSLDRISEMYYSPFYDKILCTDFAYLTTEDKRKLLYKVLRFDVAKSYHLQVKAFAAPHTPKDKVRIPQSEPKKYIKDYQLPDSIVKQVENWKMKRAKVNNSTPPIIRPKLALSSKKIDTSRKSTNDLPAPIEGYAWRMKKSQKSSGTTPVDIKILPSKENIITPNTENGLVTPSSSKNFKSGTNVLTIKALTNLEYNDIDSDNELQKLISDDKDEYFDKLYGIEPKLQSIMKMHEEKIAKGQKVVEKSKILDKKLYAKP